MRCREFKLGNAIIQGRAFGVEHAAMQNYSKWGIAIRSALLRISALSKAWLWIKSYSCWNNIATVEKYLPEYFLS